MDHPSASNLKTANLQRAKYLLAHVSQYSSQRPSSVDEGTSKAVLEILAYHFQYREVFSQADRDLIDHCGPLLVPAVKLVLEEIRDFPCDISGVLYPVLYHQYFSPDGAAIDFSQLAARLNREGLSLREEELRSWRQKGDAILSALLFPNRVLSAITQCD